MNAPLIERVPDGLRSGLPERAVGGTVTVTGGRLWAEPGECHILPTRTVNRQRRVLTDAETAALSGAGRHNAGSAPSCSPRSATRSSPRSRTASPPPSHHPRRGARGPRALPGKDQTVNPFMWIVWGVVALLFLLVVFVVLAVLLALVTPGAAVVVALFDDTREQWRSRLVSRRCRRARRRAPDPWAVYDATSWVDRADSVVVDPLHPVWSRVSDDDMAVVDATTEHGRAL